MFDIHNYNSFVLAIIAFQLFPGAGTVAILKATASSGVKSGMFAVYGTLSGDFIYMTSAVLGLAAVLTHFPFILKTAQCVGVLYLVYLGVKKLFEKVDEVQDTRETKNSHSKVFKQSLAICLTNPKAIMFFMAFFPLFLTEESELITLIVMMAHVTVISLIYQTMLVLLGNSVSKYISRWKYSRIVATRLAGIAFIVFGLKLARNIKG